MNRSTLLTISAACAALALGACAQGSMMASDDAPASRAPAASVAAPAPATMPTDTTADTAAPSRTIVDTAMASADHTTLVSAIRAAGLADTLSGAGPYTVFAPTNAAFQKLPSGTVERLTQPANREALRRILTYHVVAGRVGASDLAARIQAGGGRATLTTVQGGTLTATREGQSIRLTDASGKSALVTSADLASSNGIIHVIDTVLTPAAS